MKALKYILSFCAMAGLASCSDFLEETPQTSLSQEGIYNSVGTAKASLAGCYSKLEDYDYFGFNYFHVVNVSSGMGVSIKSNDVNLTSMGILPSNTNVGNTYTGIYQAICSANDIIYGMKSSTISDQIEKDRIYGEALFIRAMSYFNLVRLFGKVSLVTEPVTNYAEAQKPRAEVTDVYTQIINDLVQADTLLPEPASKVEGHPHRYAAHALLAKVYLTMAGNEENSPYWQKAYDTAFDVYQNGGYKLVHPYSNLFGSPHENNEESIFEVQFSASVNSGRMTETTFPTGCDLMSNLTSEGNSWGKTLPTQYAFKQFNEGDPRRDASFVYGQYTNRFGGKKYILFPTTKADGLALKGDKKLAYKQGNSEYAAWKKYYDPLMTTSATNTNFVYYRFSDLVMVLAEAANEIGKTEEAVTYMNELLDRARDADGNGTIDPLTEIYPLAITTEESISKSLLRERILRERLKELTGECDEWYTIRRRGVKYLKMIMEAHNSEVDAWFASQDIKTLPKFVYKYDTSDDNVLKNMLLPLPSDEINRNESIGQNDQNYGY